MDERNEKATKGKGTSDARARFSSKQRVNGVDHVDNSVESRTKGNAKNKAKFWQGKGADRLERCMETFPKRKAKGGRQGRRIPGGKGDES